MYYYLEEHDSFICFTLQGPSTLSIQNEVKAQRKKEVGCWKNPNIRYNRQELHYQGCGLLSGEILGLSL